MNESDRLALHQADPAELPRWWVQLNNWGWPDAIPNPETLDEYRTFARARKYMHSRRGQIMEWIELAIGKDECLQAWRSFIRAVRETRK